MSLDGITFFEDDFIFLRFDFNNDGDEDEAGDGDEDGTMDEVVVG